MINDGLVNVIANLGTQRDKAAHASYAMGIMSHEELIAMYQSSWLAGAAIDYPVEDATRNWRTWEGDDAAVKRIVDIEDRLYIKQTIKDTLISARLFGGAAMYINATGTNKESPLLPSEKIISLVPLGRSKLAPEEIVSDINNEFYGWPEHIMVQSGDTRVKVHTSRFVIFRGAKLPVGALENDFFGQSYLQRPGQAITQCDSVLANINSLVYEANVDVMRFAGYSDMLADSANDAAVTRRLSLQAAMKGINGALVMDAMDAYDKKSANFGSIPELIAKFQEMASGATAIPVTRLFGRSAAGLSGSGDGDERQYYDRIVVMQSTIIGTGMELLDTLIRKMAGAPAEVSYSWNPLRQVTELDRAKIFLDTAAAARTLAGNDAGAIIPLDALSDSVINELQAQGVLPGLEDSVAQYGSRNAQELPEDDN